MTRKLVLVNMSNWANEHFEVESPNEDKITIKPGGYCIVNPYDLQEVHITAVTIGEADGYKPPRFPREVADHSQEY